MDEILSSTPPGYEVTEVPFAPEERIAAIDFWIASHHGLLQAPSAGPSAAQIWASIDKLLENRHKIKEELIA